MHDFDTIIIGAGAVGLACGAAFARNGASVLVLEAGPGIGMGVSSRNSEVVHGGMYYPTDSLRRRLCVEGRRRLYAYMDQRGVAYRRTGKLIVATTDAETAQIETIYRRGLANDVERLELIDGAAARALEPNLNCTAAMISPETGVFDSHGYMLALQGEIEDAGGFLALNTPFEGASPMPGGGFRIRTGGAEASAVTARRLINSAGLHAQTAAGLIEGLDEGLIPKQTLAKGNYFGCASKPAFSRLIYPAPVEGGLGVHLTLDLGGRMRFGPDVEWLPGVGPDAVDYRVNAARGDSFYAAIRTYWPGLPDGALMPDYSGCRPKLSGPGEPARDFMIQTPATHGVEGLVNLFGIESPGLTSSLAIAEDVRAALA